MRGKPYSEEEVKFLVENYHSRGPQYVADHIGRTYQSVSEKAAQLKVKRYEGPPAFDYSKIRKKIDTTKNENPKDLDALIERQRKVDERRVAVKINHYTSVIVPKSKVRETLKKYGLK